MRKACFIPIKANSERVSGKNLRVLNGKKLYEYICEHIKEANVFDDVYIDTNSDEVAEYAKTMGYIPIAREAELLKNTANGNDLLVRHFEKFSEYDYYFQLFATAPYLQPKTISDCVKKLIESNGDYDSCFTATANYGFYWFNNMPVNYRPGILPRSQDMVPMVEETTGLYGISRESLIKYRCRIGSNPYIHVVNKFEAVDINTEEDFKMAECVGKVIFHYGE
jgi:N-acylneuraminate cytidylyltransferase